jgi:hypothetical protein
MTARPAPKIPAKEDFMPTDFTMNDPQNLWKNQPTEAFKMSAEQLRQKSHQRQRKARFVAVKSIIAGFAVCGFFAFAFSKTHELILRLGWAVLSLWGIYLAYQAYKWIWPARLWPDAAFNTTLQAYKNELEKQRDYVQHIWKRAGLTFCFLGMAIAVMPMVIKTFVAPHLLLHWLPVAVLLAVWFAVFLPTRRRRQQKLQQEIEELRAFERGSQA